MLVLLSRLKNTTKVGSFRASTPHPKSRSQYFIQRCGGGARGASQPVGGPPSGTSHVRAVRARSKLWAEATADAFDMLKQEECAEVAKPEWWNDEGLKALSATVVRAAPDDWQSN